MENINIELKTQYILQDKETTQFIKGTIDKYDIVLLVAPQGTGKSTLLQDLSYKHAYVSPTCATAEQVENNCEISKMRGTTSYTFRIDNTDIFKNPSNGNISTTFASSYSIVEQQLIYDIDLLIIDEAHKLSQYSTFGYVNVENTLKTIETFIEHGKKVVLTTATPCLLKCLEEIEWFKNISMVINITQDKEYISKCVVLRNTTPTYMANLIACQCKEDNFQIMLYNSKTATTKIEDELRKKGIKSLCVCGNDYRDNDQIKKQVENFQKGIYDGYKVLIVTSWVDVGLNFIGSDITHLYCIFDSFYSNGDITLIQQFMARSRNCKPTLYVTYPQVSDSEKRLLSEISVHGKEYVISYLKRKAQKVIEDFKLGYQKDLVPQAYYGIYQVGNKDEYSYSSITLNYQLYKLMEKAKITNNIVKEFGELLNTKCVEVMNIDNAKELTDNEIGELYQYIKQCVDNKSIITTQELCDAIMTITNGRVRMKRPTTKIKKYFPQINVHETTIRKNGKHFKALWFSYVNDK